MSCADSNVRLLSANGIPKLRNKAKHLKFKGKGHEVSFHNLSSEPQLTTIFSTPTPRNSSHSTNSGSTTYFPKLGS